MTANKFNGQTNFGTGVGLRVPHQQFILEKKPQIGFLEIISENFMVDGGIALEILEEVCEIYPVIQHGVALYLGSADPLDRNYLKRLKRLTSLTNSPYVTDHLCWGSIDGKYSHDLLPMPYTKEAVKHVAQRIQYVSDYLEKPFCVENISSYAEFQISQMNEWQFLSSVAEAADCGILLDINNIYVSAFNHSFDAHEYLRNIPAERVAQIHLAGHMDCRGYKLDTHDSPVRDDVWGLYREAIQLFGATNTLIEWDTDIPDFGVLTGEADKAASIIASTKSNEIRQTSSVS